MNHIRSILKYAVLYGCIIIALIMIALIPREGAITAIKDNKVAEYAYDFTAESYIQGIRGFFQNAIEQKSLGDTRFPRVTVEDELKRYVPRSLQIIIPAFILSIVLGVLKGVFDYRHGEKKGNVIGNGLTWLFQSIPDFFIIVCVIWSVTFLVPSLRLLSQETSYSFLLPTLLVLIYPLAYTARITSTALANEDGQYYIQVARSKGFTKKRVVYKHILRVAMKTILTHMTSIMIHLMTSLMIAEYLLGYQGMAYRLFSALGYHYSFEKGVELMNPEPELVIGIGLIFICLMMLAQIAGAAIKKGLRVL
ncbi:ABC transporter permease subunit [Cytobacillus purgationiresistens]|uniref:Oligopeptide transport system permease protein n=1 Tax=Cytobacillus purgationiresistens TaxID=863449 RepID=A0ABU0AM42_9BACI|nr:ABC transporter permease subunit [Cytobacillus purgationiresistens]MDQ0271954.1 oligopeptide transport system permease protein [Cytobacillus purgationiresistens]